MKRLSLGLKLWSTDIRHAAEAADLIHRGAYSYIELFSVPGSYDQTRGMWSRLGTRFVIHAPHSMKGLNPARRDQSPENKKLAEEALRFADMLGSEHVIFHPGLDGPIDESIRQLKGFADSRILVENKPRKGVDGSICVGSSPEELSTILSETGYGCCLDFGHAYCAAVSAGLDPLAQIQGFLGLRPSMFHLTDGDAMSEVDRHDRYGLGSLPLASLLRMIPDNVNVTNEGGRNLQDSLAEAEEDASFLTAVDGLARICPEVEMKRARQCDMDAVYTLSNEPDVRAVSFSSLPIPYPDHVAWFARQLKNEDGRFFVFYLDHHLVAQIRFQREAGTRFAVSVSLDKEYRGKGYAKPFMTSALRALSGARGVSVVKAYVKPENERSARYFQALGFEPIPTDPAEDNGSISLYINIESRSWETLWQ